MRILTSLALVLFGAFFGATLFPAFKDTISGSGFCSAAEEWHSTFEAYLIRVNTEGSREGEALDETFQVFKPNLLVVLPDGRGSDERELRALLQSATSGTEQWLSDLQLRDALTTDIEGTVGDAVRATNFDLAVQAHQKSEAQRVKDNAVLREVSYRLGKICGLAPLPIYSSFEALP